MLSRSGVSLRRVVAPLLLGLALLLAPAASAHRHHHGKRGHAGVVRRNVQARRHVAHRHAHATQACTDADTPENAAPRAAIKGAVLCLVNQQRTSRGLPPLHGSSRLDRSAQGWTDAMMAGGFFGHGSNFAGRISAAGYDWTAAGENIATGFPTPSAVVSAWMASPDHCRNILSPLYSDVGTGVLNGAIAPFGSGGATWTQDFGLWTGHSAPSGDSGPMHGCPYR
jgi:uncharacterized protein YkwD